jgi:cobaltochelatase CobN
MRFIMFSFILCKQVIHTIFKDSVRKAINKNYFPMAICFVASISSLTLNTTELKTLALVSDRSAAVMVAAVHQFLATQKFTNDTSSLSSITIRSVSQLNQLTNHQIQSLINQHQVLVIAGVFGESAGVFN